MDVSYLAPLRRAWARMKSQLFSPFVLERWLVLGVGAFLEGLASGGLWTGGGRWNGRSDRVPDAHEVDAALGTVTKFFANPVWLAVLAIGLVAFAIVYALLLWASARGQFVFLDNVATGRAAFRDPWRRSARLGNSLFLWWAALSFAWLVPLGFLAVAVLDVARAWIATHAFAWPSAGVLALSVGGALASALVITVIGVLVHDFVQPLMWRHDETVLQAWGRFRPLLAAHAGDFFAYLLFLLVVSLVAGVAVLVAAFGTCCIGLLLMVIPYVGAVVLLPLEVTYRAFGPEFLAQFGPEWNVFPAAPAGDSGEPDEPRG